jgi:hypothetical protein
MEVSPKTLAHYAQSLGLVSPGDALLGLARAVVCNPGWEKLRGGVLVAKPWPRPMLGFVGRLDESRRAWLEAHARELAWSCALLRYVNYAQAEADCERLAGQLVHRFGRKELARFQFTAIPRGGIIVLGMLAYVLGLEARQLVSPAPPDVPLVVTDDCALTGARLGQFLKQCNERRRIIFAHLYSHPQLRRAIAARERKVLACISARDLKDHGTKFLGRGYPAARRRWLARLKGPRYWVGMTDHICFAWGEPDRSFWNPATRRMEDCWRIVPPALCLKNRSGGGLKPIPVQVQPEGNGAIRPPGRAFFAVLRDGIVIGDLVSGEVFRLSGVAADLWRGIVKYGGEPEVSAALVRKYDVAKTALQEDVHSFVRDLLRRGLLEEN